MGLRDEFQRSKCACHECNIGCHTMPGFLIPEDIQLIAEKIIPEGATKEETCEIFKEHFMWSEGALAVKGTTRFRINTIVPMITEKGCIFLDDEGMCKIHDVAPFGCAFFDSHQSDRAYKQRSHAGLAQVMSDGHDEGEYHKLLQWLKRHGKQAPPLKQRRERYRALEKKRRRKRLKGRAK